MTKNLEGDESEQKNSESEIEFNDTNAKNEVDANIQKNEKIKMEVHHHADLHHKPKRWKEFLLEGLMIFVAVTLSFFAESYREHIVNSRIEKRNIESFIANLKSDSIGLSASIQFCIDKNKIIDSLLMMPGELTDSVYQHQLFNYFSKLSTTDNYKPDESAFLQMQSANTLRLIKKKNVLDRILAYQNFNSLLLYQQEAIIKIFFSALDNFIEVADFRNDQLLRLNENHQKVQNYINYKIIERAGTGTYISFLQNQLNAATKLISFLKKQYGIN
ncbi:MAG: hypothetical protein KF829_03855 [Ferruginibacter sp.]|nr:hypothetical protein [Ferruginibacter sp.]